MKINNSVFSNEFYDNLLDSNPNFKLDFFSEIPRAGTKVQWTSNFDKKARTPPGELRIMLNSDMCLVKEFDTDHKGFPNCTYGSCSSNNESLNYVKSYAESEPRMKADWSNVFTKMLNHGYENTNKLIDIIPIFTSEKHTDYYKAEMRKLIMKSFENSTPEEQFKVFCYLYEKKYEVDSEEGLKKLKNFKNNLNVIKEYKGRLNNSNFAITEYTDLNFAEYLYYKYRIHSVHFEEFSDLNFDSFEHLLEYK